MSKRHRSKFRVTGRKMFFSSRTSLKNKCGLLCFSL